jgi:OmpA-OmpF porin, OOP family
MKTLVQRMLIGCLLVWIFTPFAVADQRDAAGSKDHPLISRYPGSFIDHYMQKEFDEFILPLSKTVNGKLVKSQPLEGKITAIEYEAPAGRSTLEIFRNYQAALRQAGFQSLFTCALRECGGDTPDMAPTIEYKTNWSGNKAIRYLSAKLARPAGDVYVSLSVYAPNEIPWIMLYVIETKPMESGLVKVNATALQGGLARVGHVEVPGIFFDFNKSNVKPESKAALDEVSKMLKANPSMKVWVVGHTDSVGTLEANLRLSEARAAAVAKALVTGYGINAARLKGLGVGPLSPVASNKTDQGRAKNRRVELVEQ